MTTSVVRHTQVLDDLLVHAGRDFIYNNSCQKKTSVNMSSQKATCHMDSLLCILLVLLEFFSLALLTKVHRPKRPSIDEKYLCYARLKSSNTNTSMRPRYLTTVTIRYL